MEPSALTLPLSGQKVMDHSHGLCLCVLVVVVAGLSGVEGVRDLILHAQKTPRYISAVLIYLGSGRRCSAASRRKAQLQTAK